MSSFFVKPVQNSRERRQFVELPWKIYRQDPNWVPPLRMNLEELVGFRPHPFYNTAEIQTFLALRSSDGEPIGRIAAIHNRAHNERHKDQIGFFGFYESIDDLEVAQTLLRAAREWLQAKGLTAIRGPANPSLNYECGLLIDGFDTPPTFMMTHNPPYYQRLLESSGLAKVEDMAAFWGHVDMIAGLDQKMAFVIDECKSRFKVQLRRLDKSRFSAEVRMFLEIYNQSLMGTWGFTPLTEEEIDHMAWSLRFLLAPEMTAVGEIDGKPVGAVFALLDFNTRIKQIDGRLLPFGFFHLLWNKRGIDRIRVLSTNVLPEYQKWGLGLLIIAHLLPSVFAWGVKTAEFSWVLESNSLSYKSLKRGGAKIVKTYRMLEGPIAGD